jgi:hypothetical protein
MRGLAGPLLSHHKSKVRRRGQGPATGKRECPRNREPWAVGRPAWRPALGAAPIAKVAGPRKELGVEAAVVVVAR